MGWVLWEWGKFGRRGEIVAVQLEPRCWCACEGPRFFLSFLVFLDIPFYVVASRAVGWMSFFSAVNAAGLTFLISRFSGAFSECMRLKTLYASKLLVAVDRCVSDLLASVTLSWSLLRIIEIVPSDLEAIDDIV